MSMSPAEGEQQRQQRAREFAHTAELARSAQPINDQHEFVSVRIQWAETTRYEADFYLDPTSSEDVIWSEIANVPDALRRTLDLTEQDNQIVSVVDLDGDGVASVFERSLSTSDTVDWGELADSIDERLAESWGWPALAATMSQLANAGYDVADRLPAVAAADPLPVHDTARELQYRLVADATIIPTVADINTPPGAAPRAPGDMHVTAHRAHLEPPSAPPDGPRP